MILTLWIMGSSGNGLDGLHEGDEITMQLLTIQNPGVDITINVEPTDFYTDRRGPYSELVCRLGWEKWIWCLRDMAAFSHDYMCVFKKY